MGVARAEASIASESTQRGQEHISKIDNQPSIAVIIVNYNGRQHLEACIDELLNASFRQEQIVLVDNGSTDESADLAKTTYPKIRLISLRRNLGFGVANNSAIE